MDFEKTNKKAPFIKIFENDDEIQSMIEQDHQNEILIVGSSKFGTCQAHLLKIIQHLIHWN